ncbi:MAG: DUF1566 domain-containing protein [Spirochaetales bacterium]|nr:DUF1566 domain-containing protein [Spirochaetales bacterium]
MKHFISILLILALILTGCHLDNRSSDSETDTVEDPTEDFSGIDYQVIDTGQTTYFNDTSEMSEAPSSGEDFYGQDAGYSGKGFSFSLENNNYTVYDENTGLHWMRGPNSDLSAPLASDKLSYDDALDYVDDMNNQEYAGFSDWRLPTVKELYSLIDFSGEDISNYSGTSTDGLIPFIDTDYFNFDYGELDAGERLIDSQYLSATIYVQDPGDMGYTIYFGVNFADGRIKGYEGMLGGEDKTFFVQLVRGNTKYGTNNFTNNGDGTVTDSATGLMWSQDDSGSGMNWKEALAWAETKNTASYNGYSDWRLPNAKELQSIVDYSHAPSYDGKPAIDTDYFNCTEITNEENESDYPWYWTGTTHISSGGTGSTANYICFGRALGYSSSLGYYDVHGAGCQRSDPKYTDFSEYTYLTNGYYNSSAPQGDVIRMNNYVRLVRDAD